MEKMAKMEMRTSYEIKDNLREVSEMSYQNAYIRFKKIAFVRSKIKDLQMSYPIGSEIYTSTEHRAVLWGELLTRVKMEMDFHKLRLGPVFKKHGIDVNYSDVKDIEKPEIEPKDLVPMKELYNKFYTDTNDLVFSGFKFGMLILKELDCLKEDDFKNDIEIGLEYFKTHISPCIIKNFKNQSKFLGNDDSELVEITPYCSDKVKL